MEDQGVSTPLKYTRDAGQALNIAIEGVPVRRSEDLEGALSAVLSRPLSGLLTFADDLTVTKWPLINGIALKYGVPTMCQIKRSVLEGCLISYGVPLSEFNTRVASQVDRILRGAKPADIPFEQPTRFELAVNLTAAKALGLVVPQSILLLADEVVK